MESLENSSFTQFERRALIITLCQRPHWPLAAVLDYIATDGAYARTLGELTLRELAEAFAACGQRSRLARATYAKGEAFDVLMLEVLHEAAPREVAASYLSARLGGPRWKLRDSLARLEHQGLVTRKGMTSDTTYSAAV